MCTGMHTVYANVLTVCCVHRCGVWGLERVGRYTAARSRMRNCRLCAVRDMAASQQHSNTMIIMCMCWRAVMRRSTLACAAAERTVAAQWNLMANNRSGSGSRSFVIRKAFAHCMHVHRYAHSICECADSVLRALLWCLGTRACRPLYRCSFAHAQLSLVRCARHGRVAAAQQYNDHHVYVLACCDAQEHTGVCSCGAYSGHTVASDGKQSFWLRFTLVCDP
jgi:hypothetical protein